MLTKLLISAAIALGAAVGVAAPALADPDNQYGVGADCAHGTVCQRPFVGTQTIPPDQVTAEQKAALSALNALPPQPSQ